MPDSYIQELFADRIGGSNYGKGTAVYKFEKIRRARDAAVQARPDLVLIDMGVGEPDGMAYPGVVNALSEQAAMPENRGYSDNGLPEFKEAVAHYMARVYGVEDLDPETEINHAVGAKNVLAFLPTCFINPGDAIIMHHKRISRSFTYLWCMCGYTARAHRKTPVRLVFSTCCHSSSV